MPCIPFYCAVKMDVFTNDSLSVERRVFFREEKQHIKLPRDIEDAKNLGKVLSRYTDKYYMQVLSGYFVTYILYPFLACT